MDPDHSSGRRLSHFRAALDVTATFAIIAVSSTAIWALAWDRLHNSRLPTPSIIDSGKTASSTKAPSRPELPVPSAPLSLAGAEFLGNKAAPVVLLEYSDFQCPFCGRFARETLPALKDSYIRSGKVLFAFRNFPLAAIHPLAQGAAAAAVCAGRQGHFWEMHDGLFESQGDLDQSNLVKTATVVGLNLTAFTSCLHEDAVAQVKADAQSGEAAGVVGTPAFFIGTVEPGGLLRTARRLNGAQSLQQFQSALEAVLVQH